MNNSTTDKIAGIFLMFFSESVTAPARSCVQFCVTYTRTPSKGICLEIFLNAKTDLENIIYEKRLKRLGSFSQTREGGRLKRDFINRKGCCKQEERNPILHII